MKLNHFVMYILRELHYVLGKTTQVDMKWYELSITMNKN